MRMKDTVEWIDVKVPIVVSKSESSNTLIAQCPIIKGFLAVHADLDELKKISKEHIRDLGVAYVEEKAPIVELRES